MTSWTPSDRPEPEGAVGKTAVKGVPTFRFSRWLFLRALAVVYALAFASLGVQITGLVGEQGLLPAIDFLDAVEETYAAESYRLIPTVFWILPPTDVALTGVCVAGVALAVVLFLGLVPHLALLGLWGLYLSLYSVGRDFLGFQWDSLLLETGFLALFLAPLRWRTSLIREAAPSWIGLSLLWFLLFKLMFASGAVKLASGDPVWRDFTALEFHFETQPIPTVLGWYAHQLPDALLSISTFVMFFIELAMPFALCVLISERFYPGVILRTIRNVAFAGFAILMLAIAATGNYGIFNLLTLALAILMVDDRTWASVVPRPVRAGLGLDRVPPSPSRAALATVAYGAVAVGLVAVSATFFGLRLFRVEDPGIVQSVRRVVAPFASLNTYGLFANMTVERPEIRIEGSADGVEWKEYEFRYKPGDASHKPPFVAPHMPRLDWQMWFAALEYRASPDQRRSTRWYKSLLEAIFENRVPVLELFAVNPFPDEPPRFLRSTVASYRFSSPEERRESGAWWTVEPGGLFHAVIERPDTNG